MRNYAETCKGIRSYNPVYSLLVLLLTSQRSVYVVQFLYFPKGGLRMKFFHIL